MNSHLESFLIFYLKIIALLLGITILKSEVINYFRFNLLAACVAAAVSELKKAVSAVAAAAVVGIGLLVGSLFLLADPVGTGRGGNNPPFVNVCAPTVEAIWITEDQASHQFTVEVTLSSDGWEQFPTSFWNRSAYALRGSGWLSSGGWVDLYVNRHSLTSRDSYRSGNPWVYLDLPSSSSSDYSFELQPTWIGGMDSFPFGESFTIGTIIGSTFI